MSKSIAISKEVRISLISVFVGALLSLASTVGYDAWKDFRETRRVSVSISRKLLDEIRYNLKIAQLSELTGREVAYKLDVWTDCVASRTYYDLPVGARRSLDSFYSVLRLRNDRQIAAAKFAESDVAALKATDLGLLAIPFWHYLKQVKVISDDEKTLVDWKSQDFGFYNPETSTFRR